MVSTKEDCIFNAIKNIKIPTEMDNNNLILEAQAGNKLAIDKLIMQNGRLVYYICKTKFQNPTNREDLIQEGFIGLMKAISNFEVNKDSKFSTYACMYIYKSMCIYNTKNINSVTFSQTMAENIFKIKKAKSRLETEHMDITVENILKISGLSLKEYKNVESYCTTISLDKTVDEEESTKFGDMIEDETNIEYDIINKAVSSILVEIIKKELSQRNYDIICMRFGLDGYQPCTLEKIASKYNISQVAVNKIIKTALSELSQNTEIQTLR